MKLIIITPAICRPYIHNQVFPLVISSINKYNIFSDVIHYINIDNVSGKKFRYSVLDTENNLKKIYRDTGIKLNILKSDKPCFYNAIKNLVINIKDNIEKDTLIFYLEDDWKLIEEINFYEIIEKIKKENNFNENLYLRLYSINNIGINSRYTNIEIDFKPSIWGSNIYKLLFESAILNNKNIYDPELVVNQNLKKYCLKNDTKFLIYLYHKFVDIGRDWQKKNSILKWKKWKEKKRITYK